MNWASTILSNAANGVRRCNRFLWEILRSTAAGTFHVTAAACAADGRFHASTTGIRRRNGKDGYFPFGLPGMAGRALNRFVDIAHAGGQMFKIGTTFFTFVFIDGHNG